MATNLPFCFFIQFLEQLLKFLVNFTLLKYAKSQRSYGFLITKKLIFGFQILDLKVHFSASLKKKHYKISKAIDGVWTPTAFGFIKILNESPQSFGSVQRPMNEF